MSGLHPILKSTRYFQSRFLPGAIHAAREEMVMARMGYFCRRVTRGDAHRIVSVAAQGGFAKSVWKASGVADVMKSRCHCGRFTNISITR